MRDFIDVSSDTKEEDKQILITSLHQAAHSSSATKVKTAKPPCAKLTSWKPSQEESLAQEKKFFSRFGRDIFYNFVPSKRLVMGECCVPDCSNQDGHSLQGIKLYSFPKDVNRRKKWVNAIKIPYHSLQKSSQICEVCN